MSEVSPMPDAAIESMLKYAAELGMANGFTVDYSMKSVLGIDKALNTFHKEYEKETQHNEEALSGICLSLGIYIGESMRRALPGVDLSWKYGVPAMGGDSTAFLRLEEVEVYPVDWIGKQIVNGKSESIVKKYKYFLKTLQS